MKGYEKLSDVFTRAHKQASEGKGAERHATEAPFHEQPMMQVTGMVGSGFPLGQAIKKIVESQGMPPDRAVNELLGAICYLAGGIIHLEAANDNQPQPEVYFEPIMKHETVEYLDEHYNLIDVEVGTIIPSNWIKIPEGAEKLTKGIEQRVFWKGDKLGWNIDGFIEKKTGQKVIVLDAIWKIIAKLYKSFGNGTRQRSQAVIVGIIH